MSGLPVFPLHVRTLSGSQVMDVCADTTLQEIYDVLQVKTGLSAHAFHMKDGGAKKWCV